MSLSSNHLYVFGAYTLDPSQKLLFRDEKQIPLTNKAYEVLVVLAESAGRIVEKEQLMRTVWPDTFVEEGNLTFHVHALRRALDDQTDRPLYIETVPRRGYRFVAKVSEIAELGARGPQGAAPQPFIAPAPAGDRRRMWMVASAACVVVLAAIVSITLSLTRKESVTSAAPLVVRPFTAYAGAVQSPSFSPDGERIAFSWTGPPGTSNWNLYVKVIGAERPLRLTNDPGIDLAATWSPDGREIAFLREQPKEKTVGIYLVGALGGPARKLIDVNYGRYFDLSWSPDGDHIAFAEKQSPELPYDNLQTYTLNSVSVSTLERKRLTSPPGDMSDHRFAYSPDGKSLAFLRHGYDSGVAIFVVPATGGTPRLIYSEHSWLGHLAWAADGQSLIFTSQRDGGSSFFRVGVDGGAPQPLPLTEELAYTPTVSRRGNRFAYVREYYDTDLYRMPLDAEATGSKMPQAFLATARVETCPAFSPDGTRLAFLSDRSGRRELWLSDADGTSATQLTDFFAWSTTQPSWSPDSKQLLFFAGHGPAGTGPGLFLMNMDDRTIRRISSNATYVAPRWSHDGKWIYAATGVDGDARIWRISPDSGQATQIANVNAALPQESPDGKFIYYLKWPSGIWRMPAEGGAEEEIVAGFRASLMGHWQAMNDGVFYVNASSSPFPTIEFLDLATRKSKILFTISGMPTAFHGGLTISPDRKEIVFSQDSRSASEIMLVENFR